MIKDVIAIRRSPTTATSPGVTLMIRNRPVIPATMAKINLDVLFPKNSTTFTTLGNFFARKSFAK